MMTIVTAWNLECPFGLVLHVTTLKSAIQVCSKGYQLVVVSIIFIFVYHDPWGTDPKLTNIFRIGLKPPTSKCNGYAQFRDDLKL